MWSDELQEQTREFLKTYPMAAMKKIGGVYGVCVLEKGIYIIKDRKTAQKYSYSSINELIFDKWVID